MPPNAAAPSMGSSPLSRGIRIGMRIGDRSMRIIPALAGNTSSGFSRAPLKPDHPRSRGEYCQVWTGPNPGLGSSPLSRGIPCGGRHSTPTAGIIPALAGNTCSCSATSPITSDHPRSRGEYLLVVEEPEPPIGSSPLSRGIPLQARQPGANRRIIPALAGNT